jgi:tetratricopeptide (TPR) repeat protein
MKNSNQIDKLMNEGFEALESYDTKKAIKIGKQLKRLKHTSAFEILALAYADDEKLKKAIKILEEGVRIAPTIWRLWQLLGNYRSDNEEYDEAQICYKKALECPITNTPSIRYNSAIAYFREEKYLDAEKQINLIDLEALKNEEENHSLALYIYSKHIFILNQLNKYQEALKIASKVLKHKWNEMCTGELASFYTAHAYTLWLSGNKKDALSFLWKSIKLNHKNQDTLALIRQIENKYSNTAKYYRILIEGIWSKALQDEDDEQGFFINYYVVAENLDQGLTFIKRVEPKEYYSSISINKHEVLQAGCDDLLGVYEVDETYWSFPLEK